MRAPLATGNSTGSLAAELATAHISPETETVVTASTKATTGENVPLSEIETTPETEPDIPYRLDKQGACYLLPKCHHPPQEEMNPVENFVEKAVKEFMELPDNDTSRSNSYRVLVGTIKTKNDPPMLYKIFLAIRTAGNGSTLHQLSGNPAKHGQLMHVLLRFNPFVAPFKPARSDSKKGQPKTPEKESSDRDEEWAKMTKCFEDYSLADAYFHLILALISANSVNAVPAITAVWKLLVAYSGARGPPLARTQRLHAVLAELIRLCPKGIKEILPIMQKSFPFRLRPKAELIWAYRQAFAVVEYVPDIYKDFMQFVIDKCLEMDVEIKIVDGGNVALQNEESAPAAQDTVFELEEDEKRAREQQQVQKDTRQRTRANHVAANDMADKYLPRSFQLDAIMLLTFQSFEKEAKHNVLASRKVYERCYPVFENSILIAHRSKFVQFILFFLCGLENDALEVQNLGDKLNQEHATLYREFVAKLLELIMDPFRPSNVRQCAACYLASFVSRARYVEPDTVCECVCALLLWAETYIATLPAFSISASDVRNQSDFHSLFYTICQAAFYIMCFRGKETVKFYRIIEERESSGQTGLSLEAGSMYDVELQQVNISPSRWTMICGHPLQPLRFCLESVRMEFLQIAENFDLIDSKVIERITSEQNRSLKPRKKKPKPIKTPAMLEVTRRKGGVGGLGRGSNPLDSFFPFDPYLLSESHAYIAPFYKHWGEEDDEDDNDYDENVDMQEDDNENEEKSAAADVSDIDDSSAASEDGENFPGSYEDPNMILSTTPVQSPSVLAAPRQPWTETLKRNRASSIESGAGSW